MTQIRIFPYSMQSMSARVLRNKLPDSLLVRRRGSYSHNVRQLIINWGNSTTPRWYETDRNVLNRPYHIAKCTNKLRFYTQFADVLPIIPHWTTYGDEVRDHIATGGKVLERTQLSAHSGRGIEVHTTFNPERHGAGGLFVRYIPRRNEYRFIVFRTPDGEYAIPAVYQKRRTYRCDNPNWTIRTHRSGFIYTRSNVEFPHVVEPELAALAIRTLKAVELDFAAVDIITTPSGNSYVLEVNTAPGLEGSSVPLFCHMFEQWRKAWIEYISEHDEPPHLHSDPPFTAECNYTYQPPPVTRAVQLPLSA
jgi:hypothetical protein